MRTQYLSFPSKDAPDVSPPRAGHDLLRVRGIRIKKTPLRPVWAQEFDGWPINGFDSRSKHPYNEGWKGMGPTSGQYPGARAPRASQPTIES